MMKFQTLPISIVLIASLSCSLTSANLFNENEVLPGLRGPGRKQNKKVAKIKTEQEGPEGRKKKPANKKNNSDDKGRDKSNKKDNPNKKERPNKNGKPSKIKPGKKDKPQQTKPDERIIGGSQATPNANKFVVSLQDHIGHFCGGSLIAKDVVLSAAHCQGGPYDVVLGRHDLDSRTGQEFRMRREVPHPNYRESTTDNDFMLVFLDGAATLNNNVDTISLNDDSNNPSVGGAVTVLGWGDTDIRDDVSTLSDVLMKVNVNVISNRDCDDSSGSIGGYSDNYNGQITDNMLCARANRQDSCQGDSGGPLVKGNKQVGVVSWGIGCASQDFPGVYARVSRAYDWIQREVCRESQHGAEAGFDCSGVASNPSPPSASYNNPSPSPPSNGGDNGGGNDGGGNKPDWDDDWDDDWFNNSNFGSGGGGGGGGGGNGNKPDKNDDWNNGWDDNWDDDWSNNSNSGSGGAGDDDWRGWDDDDDWW